MTDKKFPGLFFPDEKARTVMDVDYEGLKDRGIKGVIFDLDNTIARWGDRSLEQEIIELFDRITSLGLQVAILTNSRREEIENFIKELPVPHLFNANKPRKRGFQSILRELEVSGTEAAMVGDQLFTDVLGANRVNMYTIHVEPIDPSREYHLTRINRLGEKVLLTLREVYRFFRSWSFNRS